LWLNTIMKPWQCFARPLRLAAKSRKFWR